MRGPLPSAVATSARSPPGRIEVLSLPPYTSSVNGVAIGLTANTANLWEPLGQPFQRTQIAPLVAVVVYGSLSDKGAVCKPRVIQQPPKGILTDSSLPDVLVAIEF